MPADRRQAGKRGGRRSTSWKPGQSGNPKGRQPDAELAKLRAAGADLFGPHAEEARGVVLELMRKSKSDKVRLASAETVLERALGKPPVEVQVDDLRRVTTDDLLAALPEALAVLKGAK